MKEKMRFVALVGAIIWGAACTGVSEEEPGKTDTHAWRPLRCSQLEGLLSERIGLWRRGRLWHMLEAQDGYLLSGFEKKPGIHPWQGEHVGKWLHAATLAYEQTRDERLLKALQDVVGRLLATQEPNGYLGTYGADYRFTAKPENVSLADLADDIEPSKGKKAAKRRPTPFGGWDTWTLRYTLYGLLTYERFHRDPRIVEACKRMADLLIEVYGEGKYDLTKYGTRRGISATTLLESIVMLYERTRQRKYLDFALHIVAMSEANPGLRLMGTVQEGGSLTKPGEGKAYQMMANLLGYIRLHACTADPRYLETARRAWEAIRSQHTYTTGGPWGRKMPYNGNRECFALPKDFAPTLAQVETCSTTTWIQMNLHLLEVTGEAKYAAEAERVLFNALLAAQNHEGIDWCYFTKANSQRKPFEARITCCASSGPRALEAFASRLIGEVDGAISLASLTPCQVTLSDDFGNALIRVKGDYPIRPSARILFVEAKGKAFGVEFREPFGARLASVRINGKQAKAIQTERGFHRINRSWKTGDEMAIDFEYQLRSHVVKPHQEQHWVAFTYGPWALARKGARGEGHHEPFIGKKIASKDASEWLEPLPTKEGGLPTFQVKGSEVVLQPYFNAGGRDAGPQTYFKLLKSE